MYVVLNGRVAPIGLNDNSWWVRLLLLGWRSRGGSDLTRFDSMQSLAFTPQLRVPAGQILTGSSQVMLCNPTAMSFS